MHSVVNPRTRSTRALNLLALGFLGFAIIVALALPVDVLMRFPAARSLTDAVAAQVPAIERFGRLSDFPEVTRLFHALMAVASSLLGIAFTLASPVELPFRRTARERPGLMLITLLLIGGVCAAILWGRWEITPERLRDPMGWAHGVIGQMSRYRLALGIWGAIFWITWAGAVWMFLLLIVGQSQRRR